MEEAVVWQFYVLRGETRIPKKLGDIFLARLNEWYSKEDLEDQLAFNNVIQVAIKGGELDARALELAKYYHLTSGYSNYLRFEVTEMIRTAMSSMTYSSNIPPQSWGTRNESSPPKLISM